MLEQPLDVPTEEERLTPAARAARQDVLQALLMWTPGLAEEAAKRLEREGIREEEHRNDATLAITERLDEHWSVRWVLADQGSRLAVRSVSVEPIGSTTPAGGLNADLLRRLSPAGAIHEAAASRESATPGSFKELLHQWARRDAVPLQAEPQRRGRPAHSDEFLCEVALAYLAEAAKGRGVLRRVGLAVAPESYRGQTVPDQTVRDWVRKARTRGFLGPAPKQGARGGEPGPRLPEFLKSMREASGHE